MTQDQTQAETVAEEIVTVSEEIDTRREEEKERHNERMEELDQRETETMEELAEKADIPELEAVWGDICELRDDILSQQKALKQYLGRVLNKGLPTGGHKERITLKDNWVYRYNKRRNPDYSLGQVLTHSLIEELIETHYSEVEAQQWKLAFSQLDEHSARLQPPQRYSKRRFERTIDLDWDDEDDWATITIKIIVASYIRNGDTEYIKFAQTDEQSNYHQDSLTFQLPTRDPEHLELLARHQSEIHDALLDLKRELADETAANEEIFAEVTDLIPVEVEEDYQL